jgi:MFS family permease
MRLTALPLLTAALTRSPLAVSAVAAAQGLPWLLFSLPAGALVDRWDRRRVVLVVNAARAVLAGLLALVVAVGVARVWLLAVAAFGLTFGETLADAATRAVLPAVVDRDRLESANGRLFAAETATTQFAGPPVGSALFALRHTVPFAVDAASFAAAVVLFRRVQLPVAAAQHPVTRHRLWHEVGEGLRWLLEHRVLRALLAPLLIMNLVSEAVFAIFVLFALQDLHVGTAAYGLLFVAYAAGGLIGSTLATRLRNLVGDGPAILGSIVLFGAPFLVLAATSNAYLAGAMMVVSGLGEGAWGVLTMSLRQAVIPDHLLGRVLSAFRFVGWGSLSLGAVLGGVAAHAFGLRAPIIAAGVIILVTAAATTPFLSTTAIQHARAPADTQRDSLTHDWSA